MNDQNINEITFKNGVIECRDSAETLNYEFSVESDRVLLEFEREHEPVSEGMFSKWISSQVYFERLFQALIRSEDSSLIYKIFRTIETNMSGDMKGCSKVPAHVLYLELSGSLDLEGERINKGVFF